ncbi:holin family protein [Pseudoponticoccus marisrubri]|uniref:Carboxylesterase n=1 Tax=Pseudoponticoccus marisrubri TaxID=1685382 RepID=A0A0W7WPC1_9RHOB|nr:holin family protein [Pseudoponticoccus marisrubri]KUF12385.1 carboxylesterase [Pseudoponticoccus marisrubri]
MGMIEKLLSALFGGGRNVVAETAEVFRINAEAQAARGHDLQSAALGQFAGEFRITRRGWFDRLMDALNRLPRPAMALGTLGLFVAAMVDPVWFAARMAGIALVPEPLWWLLAAIVSFYFGARHQAKGQEFQREMAATIAAVPQVVRTMRDIDGLRSHDPEAPATDATDNARPDVPENRSDNPALAEWRAERSR